MSYDSSSMDDNENTPQGIQIVVADSKNVDVDLKRSWECPRTNLGIMLPSSEDIYEYKVHSREIELDDTGSDQGDEGASVENPQKKFVPVVDDADEVVVDVSPNGHSLSSLNSYVKQNSRASHVKGMYVFDNKFTVLPSSVSRFNNLRSLKIFSNEVKLLPDDVGNIDVLEHLQMKVCPTGLGELPPLGRLSLLKTLELHQTPFRPSIFTLPSEISKLQLLTRLAVCNFSISFLPPEIGDLKNLEELDLSFNKLKTLPREISSLISLKHFRAENNKLIELPSGLASLPNLSSIDVAHNKLTSLESLGLSLMTSLRVLNAKFNKIRNIVQIPEWVTCSVEGNPSLLDEGTSSSDASDSIVDSDLPPTTVDGDEVSTPVPVSTFMKEMIVPKNPRLAKNKKGWKRQGIQQLQARQDRLNLSRKSKVEVSKDSGDIVSMREGQVDMEEQASSRPLSIDLPKVLSINETELNSAEEKIARISNYREADNAAEAGYNTSSYTQKDCRVNRTSCPRNADSNSASERTTISVHCSRKAIGGDRINQDSAKQSIDNTGVVGEDDGQTFTFTSKPDLEPGLVHGRRKGGSLDRNPKPTKRRKSAQAFSEASYTYRTKSLVNIDDHLQDGFYDAGRERPFVALEMLESQQLCLESREVILVDRDKDEELDVIALSAQRFIGKLELAGGYLRQSESLGLTTLQKAMMLALFVSDCFGGSDKTLNVMNARRAALGGCVGVPFLCSCSSASLSSSNESNNNDSQGTVPSVHELCETSARLLKAQRQSNVVPLGLLPYGVCRHRAILFKYLCDRASVPCELVRGYLDYVPHAWNIVIVEKENASVRMLVDSCRPLDVREEKDPEYFCRYVPFRRFQLPSQTKKIPEVASAKIVPVLLDEIGRGASGSVVQKCMLGSVTAAAKVHSVDQASEMVVKDVVSRFLSELRIFCSLTEHPHIVSFYGHEFSSGTMMPLDNGKQGSEAIQLTIFMEYVPGVSLEMVLSRYVKEGRRYMPIKQAAFIAKAVVHALSFIHSKGVVHRDIKSSNVLVDLNEDWDDSTPVVKLCDFDSAVPLSSSSAHTCYLAHRGIPPVEVCVGTPRWMAPEVFQAMYSQRSYGLEADMWSFGCLILEMLTLQVPYAGLSEAQIHSFIQAGRCPPLPVEFEQLISEPASVEDKADDRSSISDKELEILKVLISLFKSCTESSSSNRPTALEAFKALSAILDNESTGDFDIAIVDSNRTPKTMDDPCQDTRDQSSCDRQEKFDCTQLPHEKTKDVSLIQEIER